MKILVVSDLHLDAVTAGRPRLHEVVAYLDDALERVRQDSVDLVIFAGDAFDPGGLMQSVYSAQFCSSMLEFASTGASLVAIAGNHDVIDTSELFEHEPVTTLTPLRVAAHYRDWVGHGPVFVLERPAFVKVDVGWGVLALPYVSRVHREGMLSAWTAAAFDAATKFRHEGGQLVVVGHLVVPGATLGSESAEMARGQDQIFPFRAVKELGPTLVINGHYHARQEVLGEHDLLIQIPGSPLRFTFGEVDDDAKGFLMASFS